MSGKKKNRHHCKIIEIKYEFNIKFASRWIENFKKNSCKFKSLPFNEFLSGKLNKIHIFRESQALTINFPFTFTSGLLNKTQGKIFQAKHRGITNCVIFYFSISIAFRFVSHLVSDYFLLCPGKFAITIEGSFSDWI